MLGAASAQSADGLFTRLMVDPPGAVPASVLPRADPEAAGAHAATAGIPEALLARFGASVRQTHERANVVVLDVPPDRQQALVAALGEIGITARPPYPIQPLLNDSVPL
ncbi:MAG TPA: hypothetical protein VL493_02510, partial [Candidatus Saccharimonadales bacterium]|nr:hypothetical protein [Candidatus Saccharimonadales bacterium]